MAQEQTQESVMKGKGLVDPIATTNTETAPEENVTANCQAPKPQ
jgi:hypothetical protein